MSEKNSLRHLEFWDQDPLNWNVNNWDIYFIGKQPQATCQFSHSALSQEIKVLMNMYVDTEHPASKASRRLQNDLKNISKNSENKKIWDTRNRIASLNVESELIDLESDLDKKKATQAGLRIARRVFQVYADMELDAVERERNRLKENENKEIADEETSSVNTFHSNLRDRTQCEQRTPENQGELDSSSEYIITCESDDLPETCEEVEEKEMSLDLQEPSIVRIVENNSEGLDWYDVMRKVEAYREQLKEETYAFDPLYYYLIDHSGFHNPTSKLLSDFFPQMFSALPKVCFDVPKLTEEEAEFIDKLLEAEDVDDVPAVTEVEKNFRKLFSRTINSITLIRKNDLPEVERTFHNVIPLLDATIGKGGYFWVKHGEQSLEASAIRRNKERDPNERARIGFKVDVMIEYQNLPVISCLEVSGGLPRCSRSKEWDNTLNLGLELRDLWMIARDQLMVWWGLTVVGRKIRVYAFAATGGLFHLVLMYETSLPSSREDLYNLELCYLVLKEYKKKLDETKNMLCESNRKKVHLITRKRDLEESTKSKLAKKPKIANSPNQKQK